MAVKREIKALTGLRGAAALIVVAYHYLQSDIAHPGPIRCGYLAVDLFFILSGFVMALNYGERFRDGFDRRRYLSSCKRGSRGCTRSTSPPRSSRAC